MRLKVNVPAGHLKKVNQKLFDMDMQHSHQLGENIFGRYIIIRSVDLETVRKVFAKLELPCVTKVLTK